MGSGPALVVLVWAVIMSHFLRSEASRRIGLVTARPRPAAVPAAPVLDAGPGPLERAALRRYGPRAGAIVLSLALRAELAS